MAPGGKMWIIGSRLGSIIETGLLSPAEDHLSVTRLKQAMNSEKQIVNKKIKALLGLVVGTLVSAVIAVFLYGLTGQVWYLAILGLGAGIGFSIGGGLDNYLDIG